MHGVQLVEVDIEDDSIQVEKNPTDERLEILGPLGPTSFCTICAKTHSIKKSSCVEYGIFTTEVFLCFNQECGKIFESEIELEQHGNSCQVSTDSLCSEIAAVKDEYLEKPDMRQCKDCRKKFKKRTRYLQHMRIFHPELYKCNVIGCHQFFRKQIDIEEHKMKKHTNCVFCAICNKDYKSKLTLESHILDQHLQKKKIEPKSARSGAGKAECIYCGKFYKHVSKHTTLKHPEKCVKCLQSGCCLVFLSEEAMQVHFKLFHVPAKCDICQKNFISNSRLKAHILNQHTYKKRISKRGKTKCCYCGKFKQNISIHVQTYHPDKLLKCTHHPNCRKRFATEKNLIDHLQNYHNPLKCLYCEEVFEKKILYIGHVKRSHPGAGLVKCSQRECVHFFKSNLEMEKHYEENHPSQAKCNLCGFLAPSENVVLQHMKKCHFVKKKEKFERSSAGKISKCSFCGKFVQQMYVHLRVAHPDKMFKGASCCKDFVTKEELQNHKLQAHGAVRCIFCGKVFDHKFLCNAHVRNKHQGGKLFKCSFRGCIFFFKSYPEMEQHFKENHPFHAKCDLCGHLALTPKNMLLHMKKSHYPPEADKLISTQNKAKIDDEAVELTMFQITSKDAKETCTFCLKDVPVRQKNMHKDGICYKCKKTFPCRGVLMQHIPTCLVQCPVCNKQFRDKYDLDLHKVSHNQDWKGLKYQDLGFKCDECRKYFKTRRVLKQHVFRIHKNKLRFNCSLCEKTFNTKSSIKIHMMGGHKFSSDIFQCPKCPKTFRMPYYLKMHDKRAHGELIKCENCGKMLKKYIFNTIRHSKFCVPYKLL